MDIPDISEKNFEQTIEQALLAALPQVDLDGTLKERQPAPLYGALTANLATGDVVPGGYTKRKSEEYDKALCLIPGDILDFIYATQPKEWEKFRKQHEGEAKARFFQRLSSELRKRGTFDVLRRGIKATGCKFQLAYFRPASGLNYDYLELYQGNIFSEVRQLHYQRGDHGA